MNVTCSACSCLCSLMQLKNRNMEQNSKVRPRNHYAPEWSWVFWEEFSWFGTTQPEEIKRRKHHVLQLKRSTATCAYIICWNKCHVFGISVIFPSERRLTRLFFLIVLLRLSPPPSGASTSTLSCNGNPKNILFNSSRATRRWSREVIALTSSHSNSLIILSSF